MKSAQHSLMQEPSHNLFNILRRIVMASVHQNSCLRTCGLGQKKSHSPIRNISVIKSRLERFIFHKQALTGNQERMCFPQTLLEIFEALTDVLRARVIRAVGEPERNIF